MQALIFFGLLFICGSQSLSILDFGAIPFQNDTVSAKHNSDVLKRTFYAANSNPTDRVVLIPEGYDFYFFSVDVWGLDQIIIQIDGSSIIPNLSRKPNCL
jgi:hypothetical protein